MRSAYPIIMTPGANGFTVYIPDFNINTQGDDLMHAIEMARDAIGLIGIDMQDDGEELPIPSDAKAIEIADGDIFSLADVDFKEYRCKNSQNSDMK